MLYDYLIFPATMFLPKHTGECPLLTKCSTSVIDSHVITENLEMGPLPLLQPDWTLGRVLAKLVIIWHFPHWANYFSLPPFPNISNLQHFKLFLHNLWCTKLTKDKEPVYLCVFSISQEHKKQREVCQTSSWPW